MTISVSPRLAVFIRIGPLVFLQLLAVLTLGGTLSGSLTVGGLPVANPSVQTQLVNCVDQNRAIALEALLNGSASSIVVINTGGANFPNTTVTISIAGFYQCA